MDGMAGAIVPVVVRPLEVVWVSAPQFVFNKHSVDITGIPWTGFLMMILFNIMCVIRFAADMMEICKMFHRLWTWAAHMISPSASDQQHQTAVAEHIFISDNWSISHMFPAFS